MATYVYGDYELWTQINVNFRAWFAYTVSSTDTTYSITVYAGPQLSGNTGTVKCSLSCKLTATGQTARSTTKTFSTDSDDSSKRMTFLSSKKWTWNKTSSSQSITIKATVDRSNMTASTATKTFTIPALTSYNVSYNSNSGSGSISTQKKYYGKTLKLSDGSGFTRSGYTLSGWNTASNGSGTAYELGASYTKNAAMTLYAQWSTNYSITNVSIYRCDDVANPLSRGECIYLSFSYNTLSTTGVSYDIKADGNTIQSGTLPNTTGTIEYTPRYTDNPDMYSTDETHTFVITLGNVSKTVSAPIPTRPIDIMGREEDISMGIMFPAQEGKQLVLPKNVYIGNHDTPVGTVYYVNATSSVSSGANWNKITGAYLDLPAGAYVVSVEAYCDTLASGKRLAVRLYDETSDSGYASIRNTIHTSSTAGAAAIATGGISIETTHRFWVQAYQTQGSKQDIIGYIRAIRIA